MKIKFFIALVLLNTLIMASATKCLADTISAQEFTVSGSEEDGFRYDFGTSGGFVTNVQQDQSYDSVYFIFDDTAVYDLFRNDDLLSYENGDELTEPGEYELFVFADKSDLSSYGDLTFTIQGSDKDESQQSKDLISNLSKIQVVEGDIASSYDDGSGLYQLQIGNVTIGSMNIPNKMITTGYVSTDFNSTYLMQTYKNGDLIDYPQGGIFTEEGFYHIRVEANLKENVNYLYSFSVYFTIIAPLTSQCSVIEAPEGYQIHSVLLDNCICEFDPKYVFLSKDGNYRIDLTSTKEPGKDFILSFEKDTTAPFLIFNRQMVTAGESVASPLTYTSSEAGAVIQIYHSGIEIISSDNTLQSSGYYQLNVTDQIGNSRIYTFYLKEHYSIFDKRLIIGLLILAVLFISWIIITRKNYRVL